MAKYNEGTKLTQSAFWANLFLMLGLISFISFSYLMIQRYNPQNLAFDLPETIAASDHGNSELQPIGLKITAIDLALSITPAEIENNKWQAFPNAISYLKTTAIPGAKGNSVLYGHNWPNLLADLKKVKPGDNINIIYSDNSSKDFEVEYVTKVSPSETSILKDSPDNRITLYTCAGFLDSERLVVIAKLLNS
jgi:sortase (surface protein transpeptidase)